MKIERGNIVFGFSEASDGNMKLHDDEIDNIVIENRKRFLDKNNLSYDKLVSCRLIHGKKTAIAKKGDGGKIFSGYDGLLTREKDLCLSITAADCLPIYFFDHQKEIVGMLHAGYKGILKGAVKNMVKKMIKNFSSKPEDIFVYIGPHIKKCHFSINGVMIKKFKKFNEFTTTRDGQIFVDLAAISINELRNFKIREGNIEISSECTYCESKYLSFRRDKPEKVNAQIAYICFKSSG